MLGSSGPLEGPYWTSGSDEFHDSIFNWCGTNLAVNVSLDFKFSPGEPNNFGGKENCIQAAVTGAGSPDNFIYNDNACEKPFKFICEANISCNIMPEFT